MRPISEEDYPPDNHLDDLRADHLEDKMRARLEEMGRRGGPDAPDPCEKCGGRGKIARGGYHWGETRECPRCLGTGVQP